VNTEGGPRESAIALRYDVSSLPTILFVSPSGTLILRLTGYQGPGQFPQTLEHARETATKVMGWETALEKDAQDGAALLGLATHLFDLEAYADSRELLERTVKIDAERPGAQRKQARLLLAVILKTYDENYPRAETLLKQALAIHPADGYDAKLLYVLGRTYISWGKRDQARAALQEVVKSHADSPVAQKARETLVALDPRK
jgi:tetratricopeptide (TPR) repeat protein